MRAPVGAILFAALVLTSCGADGDPFYDTPDPFPAGAHGTLVRSEPYELDDTGLPNVHRVLFTSESVEGDPIVVSGLVAVPTGAPPTGGWPVVTWAHGTVGVSDPCAPSRGFRVVYDDTSGEYYFDIVHLAPYLVAEGFAVVASDYEGLGTEGVHPYGVGVSEARGLLDIVRAASEIDGVTLSDDVVIWGHSQGGHAALFAAEIAPTWTPELNIAGTIAAAPNATISAVLAVSVFLPSARDTNWAVALGYEAAYAAIQLEDHYTEEALDEMRGLIARGACSPEFEVATEVPRAGMLASIVTDATFGPLITQNDAGRVALTQPLLVTHGSADPLLPTSSSTQLQANLCDLGTNVELTVLDGLDHNGIMTENLAPMLAWTRARLTGDVFVGNCPPP